GYRVVIANSHVEASKSASARDLFNSRIAGYNLGLVFFKERAPEIADRIEHLRDIRPQALGLKTSDLYRLLLNVPEEITKQELYDELGDKHIDLLDRNFANHREQEIYHLRGVLLFGIAECARAHRCIEVLRQGKVEEFGRLMNISHDGDRVVARATNGDYRPQKSGCSDADLYRLLADLASEDPVRVEAAQLINQPGFYACNTPEIDLMADLAKEVDGVAGAQIAGAGLGGCLMILARREAVPEIRKRLNDHYYEPRQLPLSVFECSAVEGAGLAEF
ncbi:MAG TPA: hypothetical protein VK041_01505, partial [Opitutales bacterium]|nr:hypothetical protein [Opitutales bacterium]